MRNYTTSIVEIESAFKTGLHVWPVFKFKRENSNISVKHWCPFMDKENWMKKEWINTNKIFLII